MRQKQNSERQTKVTTKPFLGVEASEVEFITTIGLHINPCRACYACWFKTADKCVQNDDASEVMEKIRQADLVCLKEFKKLAASFNRV